MIGLIGTITWRRLHVGVPKLSRKGDGKHLAFSSTVCTVLDMKSNLSYQLSYACKRTFFNTIESFLFTSVAEHKSHRRPPPTNDLASVVRELDSAVSSITNSEVDTSISFEKSICLVDYTGHCLNNRSQFSFRVTMLTKETCTRPKCAFKGRNVVPQ